MTKQIGNSDLLDTWGATGDVVEPGATKKDTGWEQGERPPHEYMNWIHNVIGQAVNHVLKNGVPEWNAATEYAAGAAVQYNGNLWRAQATNTNSQPSDANSNWQRMLSLEDSDGRYARRANNLSDLNDKAAAFANIVQAATTGALGGVEKATTTEAQSGTATDKFPDVVGVKAHLDSRLAANGGAILDQSDGTGFGGTNATITDANNLGVGKRGGRETDDAGAGAANLPQLSGGDTTARNWQVESYGFSSRAVQIATEVFGTGTVRGRTFIRVNQGGTWHPWIEMLSENDFDREHTWSEQQKIRADKGALPAINPHTDAHLLLQDAGAGNPVRIGFNREGLSGVSLVHDGADDFKFYGNGGTTDETRLTFGSAVVGSPTGGSQGPGTINAEKSYQNGKRNMAAAVSSSDPGLAFDTWRTPAVAGTGGTMVLVEVSAQTDGTFSGSGQVSIGVDEDGSGGADYSVAGVWAHQALGDGSIVRASTTVYVPPGGAYRIENTNDPKGGNTINTVREFPV